ncbi:MAG: 50S ribosomal protein L24 [Tepidisphaeraceae bacterium]
MKIKQGDLVEVIAGDDGPKDGKPGRIGRVLRIDTKANRVVVEGVARVIKHVKPSQKNPQGGRIQKEAAIHISNVLPVDPATGRGSRVKFVDKGGLKHRSTVKGSDLGAVGTARPGNWGIDK